MRRGPGVDRVEDLRALSFADGEVGTALCWTRSSTARTRSPRAASSRA